MFCPRLSQHNMLAGPNNINAGRFFPGPSPPLQASLKRRRCSGPNTEDPSYTGSQQQIAITEASSTTKRPRRDLQPTFQLSFVPPQHLQGPYNTYQPTPPTADSDSDSSTDRFAAHFGDEDIVMIEHEQQKAMPRSVANPLTGVMQRLEVSRDVDMNQETAKKKVSGFRMGYRGDCEKCRLRVPGHYSHY